jgi:hypothetical protein
MGAFWTRASRGDQGRRPEDGRTCLEAGGGPMTDFDRRTAMRNVSVARDRTSAMTDPFFRAVTAFHETGHAAVAWKLRVPIEFVSMRPTRTSPASSPIHLGVSRRTATTAARLSLARESASGHRGHKRTGSGIRSRPLFPNATSEVHQRGSGEKAAAHAFGRCRGLGGSGLGRRAEAERSWLRPNSPLGQAGGGVAEVVEPQGLEPAGGPRGPRHAHQAVRR